MKSWKTPTSNEIDKAVGLLNQPAQKSYFFDNLKNPEWIKPLYEKGYFKNPPPIKRNEKEGSVQFPIWPESKFLARIANEGDAVILTEIIKAIETDNVRVKEDLLEIVSKLPVDAIVSLYPKVIKYLDDPYLHFSLVPQKIGDLIERLSQAGKIEDALKVARYLLQPIPETQSEEAKKIGLHANPKAKFEVWDYEQILKTKLVTLEETNPFKKFDLLVNLLFAAIKVSRNGEDDADTEDYLYISRSSVRAEPQFHSHELESLIISGVVSSAHSILKSQPEDFDRVLNLLESKRYNYFKKIILYLLGKYPSLDRARLVAAIQNRNFFDASWLVPEYDDLLVENFENLSSPEQKVVLDWIEAGPDVEEFIDSEKAWTGKEPANEKIIKYQEAWQLRHLNVLKDSLPPALKEKYLELVSKYPTLDEKIQEGAFYAINGSPKTKDELKDMSIEQIMNLLREWKQPGERYNGPTKEGLGIILREIVKDRIVEFTEQADKFEALDSNYIFSILIGLENGLVTNKEMHWDKLLPFLLNVFSAQQKEGVDAVKSFDQSVRRQAISLLNAGLRLNSITDKERKVVWEIIQMGLADPSPTIDEDDKFEDEITLAINSVRGEALHSIVEYALWLRRSFEKQANSENLISNGFLEMPEVEKSLDDYLKLEVEKTKAVRSVYGRYVPWLYLIDPKWISTNVEKIFSHTEKAQGDGAWNAYITLNAAYDNLLEPLKTEYAYRLTNAEFPVDKKKQLNREPNDRLVEHLMIFYWRDKLLLNDSLIKSLVTSVDVKLITHAISFMGRVIYGEKETAPEILPRFSSFWEYAFSAISADSERASALKGFTWWFASNRFEPNWLLDNLEKVIDAAGGLDSEDFALDNLAVLSKDFPERSVMILEKILNAASKPWIAQSSEKEITQILVNTFSSGSIRGKEIAKRIINSLAKKQLFNFLDLIK